MTQQGLFSLFLFLHVLAAIIAFGPALVFGLIASFAAREPEHRHFAGRLGYYLQTRVVIPVGLTMPITGALLILTAQIDLAARQNWWLGIAIILYAIAIGYAIFIQAPTVAKLLEATGGGPRPGAAADAAAPVGGPGGQAASAPAAPVGGPASVGPAGPPPHIVALGRRVQRGGILLSALIVTIVLLMVVKPQF
jgi:hypothetical protein